MPIAMVIRCLYCVEQESSCPRPSAVVEIGLSVRASSWEAF
jgi:hypothetical protein